MASAMQKFGLFSSRPPCCGDFTPVGFTTHFCFSLTPSDNRYEVSGMKRTIALVIALLVGMAAPTQAQKKPATLEGMWSDPPPSTLGFLCASICSDTGINRLNALLDDPANDTRPFQELQVAARKNEEQYIHARLTPAALEKYPVNPVEDPGFSHCEPWGVARQMFARHQLEIRQRGKDLEFRYGEWDQRRTIHMNANPSQTQQPSRLGYSAGHWDGDALVIETSHIAANLAVWSDGNLVRHSDQLRILERYTRSAAGKILNLSTTIEDPWSLREPLVFKKMWRWAPESRIDAYKDCEIPTNLLKKE